MKKEKKFLRKGTLLTITHKRKECVFSKGDVVKIIYIDKTEGTGMIYRCERTPDKVEGWIYNNQYELKTKPTPKPRAMKKEKCFYEIGTKLQLINDDDYSDYSCGDIVEVVKVDKGDNVMSYGCKLAGECGTDWMWVSNNNLAPYVEKEECKREYKVGDILEVVKNDVTGFSIGDKIIVMEVDEDDDILPYKCENDRSGRLSWIYNSTAKLATKPKATNCMKKETIVIDVPEDKIAKRTDECNRIIVDFLPKENEFDKFVREYRELIAHPISKFGCSLTDGSMDEFLNDNDVEDWPIEFKYGLLRHIANEVNGCIEPEETTEIFIQVGQFRTMTNACNFMGEIWSSEGAEKAVKIIPIEFFKSLLPAYNCQH